MGTAKENIGAAHDRCAAGQKERAGRVRPEMYESAPLGKFKSVDALLQAYNSLQAEFTRRSRRLRELEGKLAENAATAPAGGDEETAPVEKALGAAGQAENAFAPVAGTGGTAAPAGGETPAEDAPAEEAGKQAAARESACGQCGADMASAAREGACGQCGADMASAAREGACGQCGANMASAAWEGACGQCGADMASAARDAGMAGLEQGEAAVPGGAARHAAGAQGGPESGEAREGGTTEKAQGAVPVSAIEEAVERAVRRAAASMPYLMPGGSAFAAAPPRRIGSIEEAGRLARDMMGRGSR